MRTFENIDSCNVMRTPNYVVTAILFIGAGLLSQPMSGQVVQQVINQSANVAYVDLNEISKNHHAPLEASADLKQENLAKIEKMAHFEYNWNGNGGEKFAKRAIDTFRKVIDVLHIQPQIAPTGRNSLLMQYELADKSRLIFEVSENNAEKVYIPKGDYSEAEVQRYVENVAYKINEAVEDFYESKSN